MMWTDASIIADRLADDLRAFNWQSAEVAVHDLVGRLRQSAHLFPEDQAKRMLRDLRRKRQFTLMKRLAGAFILSGGKSPQIRRQLAQCLIDQANYAEAEFVLQSIIMDQPESATERTEARGLIGRIYKQIYVGPGDNLARGNGAYLDRAIKEYSEAYQRKPAVNPWPGINLCACLARAERDGIAPRGFAAPEAIAEDILQGLVVIEEQSPTGLRAFEVATALEAYVALGRYEEAFAKAREYVRYADADAFEIAGTLRQLVEVWGLKADTSPGDRLLPLLRAMLARQEGGDVRVSADTATAELRAASSLAGEYELETLLGTDRFQTLQWYRLGLERCASIARIETKVGKGFGTGWLVRGEDFNELWRGEILLLTNKHVLSPFVNGSRFLNAERPGDAIANLQTLGVKAAVAPEHVWTSKDTMLDATLVRVNGLPSEAKPLELDVDLVAMRQPPDRVYVIGHPQGRDLEFSMQDNLMVDCNDRLVQYRAPTEPGSSGSPVFESAGWRVIALHHAGSMEMRKLSGEGKHAANEGIAIRALRAEMSN